jgi:hypothetical protein
MTTAVVRAAGVQPMQKMRTKRVAALWTRVNRELAPARLAALFEKYITITIEAELSRLFVIFTLARRMPSGWQNSPTAAHGSWACSASSVTAAIRQSSGACMSMRDGAARG